MGAIAAVLLATTGNANSSNSNTARQQPLSLTAAKAMMGHSEPAAGLVGLLTLAADLTHAAAPALLHLTSLNPYVASVLNAAGGGSSGRGGAGHGLVSMSRQTRGGPVGAKGVVHGGVSSFAFQGTNTHAVLSAHPGAPAHPTDVSGGLAELLHQHRLWVLPKPHSLLTLAQTDPSTVTMHCQLSDPRLAFLLAHRVMGRALFPAAGMLEAAAAVAKTLLGDQSPDHTWACTVAGMTIAAPLQLTSASAATLLQTSINLATGSVQIGSLSAGTPLLLHNARCTVSMACKAQGTVLRPAAVAGGALGQLVAGWGAAMQVDEEIRGRRAGPRYDQLTHLSVCWSPRALFIPPPVVVAVVVKLIIRIYSGYLITCCGVLMVFLTISLLSILL